MNAHIITIGDEILIGQINDTNSMWLAFELVKLGISIDTIITIHDKKEDIINTLTVSLKKVDIVIMTGGLGPTNDDITKSTLAEYFNSKLSFSNDIYNNVLSFLKKRGVKTNDLNKLQAMVPDKALVLPNMQGTAPGLLFEQNNKICISLPGVSSEMKGIMNEFGFNAIKSRFDLPFNFYHTTLITGIGESQLAERIADWENTLPEEISIAYLPTPGILRLRLGMTGKDRIFVENKVNAEIDKLKLLIAELIFGENEQTLENIISELLIDKNATVSTAESCTGGSIAKTFTSVAGSSKWFSGSVVAYSNDIKNRFLNVPMTIIEEHGAVSQQVVELMAMGGRKQLKTDYCIATSGIAGPDGGTDDKPVGTVWIAIAGPDFVIAKCFKFGKEREINIKRTTIASLNMLRKALL